MSLAEANTQQAGVLENVRRDSTSQSFDRMALQQFTTNSRGRQREIVSRPQAADVYSRLADRSVALSGLHAHHASEAEQAVNGLTGSPTPGGEGPPGRFKPR